MSTEVALHRPNVLAPTEGDSLRWARDFGLVGGFSGSLALLGVFGTDVLVGAGAAGVVGALTGAALGSLMPALLDSLRKKVSIKWLVFLGLPVGFTWGATTGLLASPWIAPWFAAGDVGIVAPLMFLVAGTAGALQFGWFWFPYTFQTVMKGRRWPIVAMACGMAPALGWAAIATFALSLALLA